MEPEETQEFLARLLEIAIRPEFTYAHALLPRMTTCEVTS